MNKNIFALLFLITISFFGQAQQQTIQAKVVDSKNSLPIEGITVTLLPLNKSTVSHENGQFSFNENSDTLKDIVFSGIGYETKKVPFSEFKIGTTITLQSTKTTTLNEVVVNSGGVANQYKQVSKIDIKMRGVNNSQEVLRIVPGLFIGQHQGGGKAEQIFI